MSFVFCSAVPNLIFIVSCHLESPRQVVVVVAAVIVQDEVAIVSQAEAGATVVDGVDVVNEGILHTLVPEPIEILA